MSVTANGWGSREKARLAFKRSQQMYRHGDNRLTLGDMVQSDEEIVDARPLAVSNETLQITGPQKSISGLRNLILEAISNLKEPTGSSKADICEFIEDQYDAPENFERILSAKLKSMTANGKLIRVNRKYRIAPRSRYSDRRNSTMHYPEGWQTESPRVEKPDSRILMEFLSDAELAKIINMTEEEASAAAARAVAEAEAAIAEAEEAAREADAADADAEATQAFAEAAATTLRNRNASELRRDAMVEVPSEVQIR